MESSKGTAMCVSKAHDIFSILLHYAEELDETTILFDTGKGNQRILIDIYLPSQKG